MMPYILLVIDIIFAASANLLLKKGVTVLNGIDSFQKPFYQTFLDVVRNPFLVLGLTFYGISFILWLPILSKLNLHIAYPISVSLTITLIAIGSFFIYKEPISILQVIGIVIIVTGIGFVLFQK